MVNLPPPNTGNLPPDASLNFDFIGQTQTSDVKGNTPDALFKDEMSQSTPTMTQEPRRKSFSSAGDIHNDGIGAPNPPPSGGGDIKGPNGLGNPWFNANALVSFLSAFMEVLRSMKMQKEASNQATLAESKMILELGYSSAALIKSSAQAEAFTHILSGITSAIQAGIAIGGVAARSKATAKAKEMYDNETNVQTEKLNKMISPDAKAKIENNKVVIEDADGNPTTLDKVVDKDSKRGLKALEIEAHLSGHLQSKGIFIAEKTESNMHKWQQITRASDMSFESMKQFIQASGSLQKAEFDAARAVVDACQKLADKTEQSIEQDRRAASERISEIINVIRSLSESYTRAQKYTVT